MNVRLSVFLGFFLISGTALASTNDVEFPDVEVIRLEQPSYVDKFDRGLAFNKRDIDDARHQALLGHVKSQFNLAVMLNSRGQHTEAVRWYRKAASGGHDLAQYNLAVMYYNGDGIAQDYETAAQWLQRSAKRGNADAQFLLGKMYFAGQGVPRNLAKEAEWYRAASERQHALAQYNLGVLYYLGEGVPKDFIEAYAWWSVADSLGLDTSEAIAVVSAEMTEDQINEAVRRKLEYSRGFALN
ncbi:MAG: sel1 repeat family protein [Gammaproteobacteria bacterium]|nr:sel1 repeat family protein [Gammaproteobacteria bacterium]